MTRKLALILTLDGKPVLAGEVHVEIDEAPIDPRRPEPTGDEATDKKIAARHASRVAKLEAAAAERNANRATHLIQQGAIGLLRGAATDLAAADVANPDDETLKAIRAEL